MTDAVTIVPGMKFGAWEILSVDPSGRRACCSCVCKAVRILGLLTEEARLYFAPLTEADNK
jgi:hypothetical protein